MGHAVPVPDVFDAPDVLLHEHRTTFSTRHRYEIVLPDGTPAAAVEETRAAGGALFGNTVSSRYFVQDAGGVLLTIDRPGAVGRSEFFATWADGRPLGRVRQENSWAAPRFEFALADGRNGRMTGGGWGGRDWDIALHTDPRASSLRKAGDEPRRIAAVHRERRSFDRVLVDADAFALSTDPTLDRDLRALLIVGVVALDVVRDVRKNSGD